MKDLFIPITRDERQEEAMKKWLKSNGKGCIVACTGFGKTRIAINCVNRVMSKYPNIKIIALGGIIDETQIEQISKTKAYGIASIRYFV